MMFYKRKKTEFENSVVSKKGHFPYNSLNKVIHDQNQNIVGLFIGKILCEKLNVWKNDEKQFTSVSLKLTHVQA